MNPEELSPVRRITGERFEIARSQILFAVTKSQLPMYRDQMQMNITASLLGFDKAQRFLSYREPAGYRDYIKKGLIMRWPRLSRWLKPKMNNVDMPYDFYDKVCPHLGQERSDRDCQFWVADMDPEPSRVRPMTREESQ